MINVNQITAQLARMPDQALQQFAAMHKTDPYTLSLALSESNRRKEMRQAAQMGQQQPQPKVVDQEVAQMGAPAMPPQGMPPPQLPENVGIGQLPAPNMQRMAEGGIVAFEEGGEVPGYAGGVFTGSDPFDDAFRRVMRYEGGYVANDAGKGPSKFGINKAANPDLDIAKLTEKDAKRIYRERYWDKINGDELAKKNPALATVAFDTAVNMGVTPAKILVEQSGGDPSKILAAREQHYASLVKKDPETFTKYQSGWQSRLADLATSIFPSAAAAELSQTRAQASTTAPQSGNGIDDLTKPFVGNPNIARQASTARATTDKNEQLRINRELPDMIKQVKADRASNAARIPGQAADSAGYGANMSVADEARQRLVDRYAAESKGTFFGRLGENLGLSAQTRDVIGKGVEGLAPYMGGATRVVRAPVPAVQTSKPLPLRLSGPPAVQADAGLPGLVPRLEGPSSIVGGSKPIPVNPEGVATLPRTGELVGQAAVDEARLRMLADASNAAKAQRAQNLKTGEQLLAQKYDVNAAKAADDAAMAASKLDNAVPATRLANTIDQGAIQAANVAKVGAMTNAADRFIAGPSEGGLPDMAKAMNIDEESRVIQQAPPDIAPKDIEKIGKEATPKSERKGMSGEDFLMIGLGILSGQSPNALTNIGEGGLKGLQMVQAGRKNEAEAAYRDAMSKYYGAGAEAIERGAKEKDLVAAAEKATNDAFTALAKDNFSLMANPEERAKLYNRLRMDKFMQYGIPLTMLGGAGNKYSPADMALVDKYANN